MLPCHAQWCSAHVKPERGLNKECSCSPLLFRIAQVVVLPLANVRRQRDLGICIDDQAWLCHLLGADDMRLLAHEVWHPEVVHRKLTDVMRCEVGVCLGRKNKLAVFGTSLIGRSAGCVGCNRSGTRRSVYVRVHFRRSRATR